MIDKTKYEVQNSKIYNVNLCRKITWSKMKHSNLLVSVILLFMNEHYRKLTKKNEKHTKKANKNKWEMKLIASALSLFSLRKEYQWIMWSIRCHF